MPAVGTRCRTQRGRCLNNLEGSARSTRSRPVTILSNQIAALSDRIAVCNQRRLRGRLKPKFSRSAAIGYCLSLQVDPKTARVGLYSESDVLFLAMILVALPRWFRGVSGIPPAMPPVAFTVPAFSSLHHEYRLEPKAA